MVEDNVNLAEVEEVEDVIIERSPEWRTHITFGARS